MCVRGRLWETPGRPAAGWAIPSFGTAPPSRTHRQGASGICTPTLGRGRPTPGKHFCCRPCSTLPGAHSVPSSGGPFLVLQKYGLSGWLHHSCLQGSKVLNCVAKGSGHQADAPALTSCPRGPGTREEIRAHPLSSSTHPKCHWLPGPLSPQ